jgi:hypothetical protein
MHGGNVHGVPPKIGAAAKFNGLESGCFPILMFSGDNCLNSLGYMSILQICYKIG